jgi:hypothetical protein
MEIENEDSKLSKGAILIGTLSPMIFQLFCMGSLPHEARKLIVDTVVTSSQGQHI